MEPFCNPLATAPASVQECVKRQGGRWEISSYWFSQSQALAGAGDPGMTSLLPTHSTLLSGLLP